MIKRILILTMALAICLTVCSVASATGTSLAYVKTGDGGPVNVRSQPSRSSEAIGRVAYGDSVIVDWSYAGNDGWSRVVWGSYGDAYIQSRFLVSEKTRSLQSPASTPARTGRYRYPGLQQRKNAEHHRAERPLCGTL